MKAVYLFNNTEAARKILKDDKFMRLGFVFELGQIFVFGSDEEVKLLELEFHKIGAKRADPDEEIKIISRIEAQEESSACGMGLIFG